MQSRHTLVTALALALGSVPAIATAQTTAPAAPQAQPTAPGTMAPAPAMPRARISDAEAAHPVTAARLSKLDGVDLFDAENKKIGEIDEILVDARTGDIHQIIIETGGVMGIGGKKHAVNANALSFFSRAADDNPPVKVTAKEAVDKAPAPAKVERDSPFVTAGKFIGMDVLDAEGKEIGEIEDVIVDLQSGKAHVLLMEFDKSWSPVDKLYAFKASAFQPAKDRGKLMLEVRKEALEGLPSISKADLDKTDLSTLNR